MDTKIFIGGALPVAKVYTITVGGTLASETFQILVNGKVIASHTDGDAVIASTVAGLVSTWNSQTHPYGTSVTAADASPDVVLTSDVSGLDFVVTVNTPGGSATLTVVETTANAGPNDLRTGDNWLDPSDLSIGTVPVDTDDIEIGPNAPNICFGLDQSAITLNSFKTPATWTGKIGLDYEKLAQTADGETTMADVPEYRGTHLQIKVNGDVIIGEHVAASTPTGSGRTNIDLLTQAAQVDVQFCAATATHPGRQSVNILANSASTDIFIRDTALNVGIGNFTPGETVTVGDITNDGGKVYLGAGVTYTNLAQSGAGASEVNAAATVAKIDAFGSGTMVIEGDFTITALNIDGPTVYSNNIKTAGSAIGTANLDGGSLIGTQSSRARTWDNVNFRDGTTLSYDDDVVTVTTRNKKGGPSLGIS